MVTLTHSTKPLREKDIKRKWHLINLKNKILGRITPQIAQYLEGKHKVQYAPYLDVGDFVVAVNAQHIKFTGKKRSQKIYRRYSGYPGGLKEITLGNLLEKKPEEVIKHAVLGMLPKNKLRDRRVARLYIYRDEKHPYQDKF